MSIVWKYARALPLLALWLPLCGQQAFAGGGTLANGANVTGTISSGGQNDVWTFSAKAGDNIWVSASESGPDTRFQPTITLYAPDGTQLGSSWGYLSAGVQKTAPSNGTYSALVSRNDGGTEGGSYVLTLAQSPEAFAVPSGDEGGPINNGQNYFGSILRGDIDQWSFSANQNDDVWVTVSESGPDTAFQPTMQLLGPDGKLLGLSWGYTSAGVHVKAPSGGSYRVIVYRNDGFDGTGKYVLTMAKTPGNFIVPAGDEGGTISDGENKLGAILRGDLDQWSFAANQGDDVRVTLSETGQDTAFQPSLMVLGPDGTALKSSWGYTSAGVELSAPASGSYRVIVYRNDGSDGVGYYALTLAKTPGGPVVPTGDDGGNLTNGQNYTGSILRGDLDIWTFSATQGNDIWVSVSETGKDTSFQPTVEVLAPDGTSFGSSWGYTSAGVHKAASATGTYTVVVSRNDGEDGAGNYLITLAQSPGAFVVPSDDEGGPMVSGQSYPGSILRGDIDQWTFYANAGTSIVADVNETGGDTAFQPYIQVLNPDGTTLGASWGYTSAEVQKTAPSTGAYKVLIARNDGSDGTGTYSVSVITIPTANPGEYYLAASTSPDSSGTITSSPASVSGYYQAGTKVCLSASPAAGYIFTKWSGASLDGSGCLVMTSNLSVVANFTALKSLRFVPITPCRLVDTRDTAGPYGGPALAANTSRDFVAPDASACSLPYTAEAYSLNVTAVPSGKLSYLTVWPTGQPQPTVSTLNSPDGRVKANAAIIPAGSDGGVSVYATDTTNVILDVNGYFVPSSTAGSLGFYPVKPCRIVDTRSGSGPLAGPELVAGQPRTFPVLSSSCNLPSTAKAYSLNFTAVPKKKLEYLTVWPTGQQQPNVSTLNAPTGTVTANAALVPAGDKGSIEVYASDDSNLIIDVNGYFAPPAAGTLSLYNLTPCRVLDTRQNNGQPFTGTKTVNAAASSCSVPTGSQALVLNATVVPPGSFNYLSLWAAGQTQPTVSTLNALDGSITSNLAIVPDSKGAIDAFASDPTHLILDISGYFAP